MTYSGFLRTALIALVCTFCSSASRAQLSVPFLVPSFTIDFEDREFVKNDIAEVDNVEMIADGEWDDSSEYYMIPTSGHLTFKAADFQNICNIRLTSYHFDDAGDYPVKCTIVDAKGLGAENIVNLEPKVTSGNINPMDKSDVYTFNFGDDVQLSEITLRFSADFYFYKATMSLNVSPVLPEDGLKLYADDVFPFEKKTNMPVYQYYLSENTGQLDDENEERFKAVPDEGISLAGKPDGQYAIYLRTNTDLTTNRVVKHAIVNYSTKANSTEINTPELPAATEYYDLSGRRINTPIRGINLIKHPTTGKTTKKILY